MCMCVWDVCAARARAYAVTCVNPGRAGRAVRRPDRRVAAAYGDDHEQILGLTMLKNGVMYHA